MKYILVNLLALAILLTACTDTQPANSQAVSPTTSQDGLDKRSFDYRFPDGLKQTTDSEARLDEWFRDAKFGAFIHFGIPSKLAGMYKG